MKITAQQLASAIQEAMADYLENGRLNCHNPCIYLHDETGEVHYGSELETPHAKVLWSLEEGLGDLTPEKGDDLAVLAMGAAECYLPDIQRKLDESAEFEARMADAE